ncbi:MAG: hypothetical protein E6K18_07430 [Methanobacteriota archaeon]|nr:MAG: hypothetical protein E6K18_07430 [Euryarchaeota archaeon]
MGRSTFKVLRLGRLLLEPSAPMERLYGTSRLAGMMAEIDVRKFKDVDLKGGTVFAALPSVGLVSTIAATYMISALKMDQIMALDADDFPPPSSARCRCRRRCTGRSPGNSSSGRAPKEPAGSSASRASR